MTRCPKCAGCLFWNFEEWYCGNCGWRENRAVVEPCDSQHRQRAFLPVIIETKKR